MDLTSPPLLLLTALAVGIALGVAIGVLWARAHSDAVRTESLVLQGTQEALIRDGIERLTDQLSDLHRDVFDGQARWQGEFSAQVEQLRRGTEGLQSETRSLSAALRRPEVRGQWGELHLRRVVEVAGLVDRCDFTVQHQLAGGTLRPDLVVHLAGGRQLAVDAKVSLAAFLDATSSDDPTTQAEHLGRHAHQVRTHIAALGDKRYWRELPDSCDFVVMFVPSEAILQAAMAEQTDLIEYASARGVVLATPTTLIALLRTVAVGWSHERLADQAREVRNLGIELHERLATMGKHLSALGRALDNSVRAFNQTVGSLESRVLVTARRFHELGVTDETLPEVTEAQGRVRSVFAPEFEALGDAADPFGEATILDWSAPTQDSPDAARRNRGA